MISFAIRARDVALVSKIAHRAHHLLASYDIENVPSIKEIQMDLTATHANGCPMDFERLAEADDFNLAHDVCGIWRHLDRDDSSPTGGQLLDCFVPRYALRRNQ